MAGADVPRHAADRLADAGRANLAPHLADLLKKAESESAELRDAWLRARAETDNVRRQAQLDVAWGRKYAVERSAEDLLPVKDALEQTLVADKATPETLKSGAELTLKALASPRLAGRRWSS